VSRLRVGDRRDQRTKHRAADQGADNRAAIAAAVATTAAVPMRGRLTGHRQTTNHQQDKGCAFHDFFSVPKCRVYGRILSRRFGNICSSW
jgi:hypothetical protein